MPLVQMIRHKVSDLISQNIRTVYIACEFGYGNRTTQDALQKLEAEIPENDIILE